MGERYRDRGTETRREGGERGTEIKAARERASERAREEVGERERDRGTERRRGSNLTLSPLMMGTPIGP